MREIKFRGKRIDNGEWTHGSYIDASAMLCGHIIVDVYGVHRHVHPETVGQFTGLKDKNGKEIYEGDVVRYQPKQDAFPIDYIVCFGEIGIDESWDSSHVMNVVGFYLKMKLNAHNPQIDFCYVGQEKIIGNIHEVKE